ncbi:glycosyltransferase [Faecalicoccus acidiformans]|uniref:Glycosyltransferase n=1 Tax=Faecalicoccus acidiformans TaxID=915173 RepID=A0ABS2FNR8_9FIRM|nr:glycosyltransferase [Faecalicoccus acidiformans]MBM6831339.1 glycosyltransferase [Faecalicoccus acidiformans]
MGICYCVLVIYNKNIKDSISYKMLQRQIPVIVCDNSTIFEDNEQMVKKDQNVYLSMNGNHGLSRAYNCALDWIFKQGINTDDYIVLFDDDTEIPNDFFTKMENVISQKHPDILLPIVKDEMGILSPCRIQNGKVSRLADIDNCSYEEITAINTGMTIRLSLFKDYRYDENFFLDYIDHHFLKDMKKKDVSIEIVDTLIQQQLSIWTDDSQKALDRLVLFKKDIFQFYKDDKKTAHYILWKRKIRYMLKYKKISILWKC